MLIVANWKAYVETAERGKALLTLSKRLAAQTKVDIVLAPPAPMLGLLAHKNRSRVAFAAQDVSVTIGGAVTGEVSAQIFEDLGASYVIVGHSERRARGEDDAAVAAKAQHALAHELVPIICVGEQERDQDAQYLAFIRNQIAKALEPLSQKERMQVAIAYEPIWAIGKTAAEAIAPHDLGEMILYIRKVLGEYLPHKAPSRIPILYGGSAEPENIRGLAGGSGVDGFLVGHASVEPDTFAKLVKALA